MGVNRRLLFVYAVAALLTLPPSITHVAGAEEARARSASELRIQIDNFSQVNPHYYRGAQPGGRDYSDPAALGIKTVIDLQADGDSAEAKLVEAAGMHFYRIPMTTRVIPTAVQLQELFSIVSDPARQPVYD